MFEDMRGKIMKLSDFMNREKNDFGRKLYSIPEIYGFYVDTFRTIGYFLKAKNKGIVDAKFSERVMLAVTEVNGCAVCSYAHTVASLKAGMSSEEIKSFLDGNADEDNYINVEEATAIFFAQHYAESRGVADIDAWNTVVSRYGEEKALAILGMIRTIMSGNSIGIAFSSLVLRIKGEEPDSRSSLAYELSVLILSLIMLPVALINALIMIILKKPTISF